MICCLNAVSKWKNSKNTINLTQRVRTCPSKVKPNMLVLKCSNLNVLHATGVCCEYANTEHFANNFPWTVHKNLS